mgnify:CR=1 FL=1|jgi:hypothetical protein
MSIKFSELTGTNKRKYLKDFHAEPDESKKGMDQEEKRREEKRREEKRREEKRKKLKAKIINIG